MQEKFTSGNILIVTHAVVIKILLACCKNHPIEKLWELSFIHSTSLTIIELYEDYHLVVESDFSHECREKGVLINDYKTTFQ
ncbi:histidine phosphatase family protein [Salipaludibacillus sp. HK11]|uniref:histidine phosphatase family protein n=1 Tax=Salipaludibacillus sp. HK11 TaxID=3394320 RepID=UPI0039FC0514